MPLIQDSDRISGVQIVDLISHADERGRFLEIFRKEWFPDIGWHQVQSNRSESAAGVLRGLHFHHKQADYWYVIRGTIRAGLVDLRKSSPTFMSTQTVDLKDRQNRGLFIPVGVAHGFVAVTEATLIYIVDRYYDGNDEFGVLWNDPALAIEWGIENPILSQRDLQNPPLIDIPSEDMPG